MSVIMRNDIEVGGTDDDVIAKVGTAELTTQADDLSAAVNELNSSLTNKADKAVIETAPSTVSNGSSVTIPTSCRNAKVVVLYFYRYGFVDVGIITTIGIPWTNNIKCIGNRNITLKSNADNPTSFTVTTSNTDAMNLTFVRLA